MTRIVRGRIRNSSWSERQDVDEAGANRETADRHKFFQGAFGKCLKCLTRIMSGERTAMESAGNRILSVADHEL